MMQAQLLHEARLLTHNATQIAESQKCRWQAQVTMRRWCDTALTHIYQTRYLSAHQEHSVESGDTNDVVVLSESEFVALFGICEICVRSGNASADIFERRYPLESDFLIRLLVRIPEMAVHVDNQCVAQFVRQRLLFEHLKAFAECVFDCWAHETPAWFQKTCSKDAYVAKNWQRTLLQQIDRLFDVVQVDRIER